MMITIRPRRLRGVALAVLLAAATAGAGCDDGTVTTTPSTVTLPMPTATTTPSTVTLPTPTATLPTIKKLSLPGTRESPAGEYGWRGTPRSVGWMHRVVGSRQTQVIFRVRDDCFEAAADQVPTAVAIAGSDGRYLEPYPPDPELYWLEPDSGSNATVGAYGLSISDRSLCVYVWWETATTQPELDDLHRIVESIRGEPTGDDGVRINFTLPDGWDTG
jgi:hypothetical protein